MNVSTCVIYNPAAGRGKALREIRKAAGTITRGVDLRPIPTPGAGADVALRAIEDGHRRIVAAGGDGTVHEVANGVLQSGDADVVLAVWPIGSMNDYAAALGRPSIGIEDVLQPSTATFRADVGRVSVDGRKEYFINGMGIGFNGMVTVEARKIRRLRGVPLYATAFFRAMVRHFATPELTATFDETTVTGPTLALTVNLGRREGGFPVTPKAVLDDGWFDVFHGTDLRRWQLVRYFPALMAGTLPDDHPSLRTFRCRRVAIQSEESLCVHTDGELLCTPDDGFKTLTVELLPGRLLVEGSRAG